MKITITNLGVFKFAEYELADLTIICGKNNCGKTYATYALYGFFDFFQLGYRLKVKESDIKELINKGSLLMPLDTSIDKFNQYLLEACQEFKRYLPKIFAAQPNSFKDSDIKIQVSQADICILSHYEKQYKTNKKDYLLQIVKEENDNNLKISLVSDDPSYLNNVSFVDSLRNIIGDVVKKILFSNLFPECYIASTERTGAVTFKEELNFERNSILKEVVSQEKFDIKSIFDKMYDIAYPLPVRRNIDFVRNLYSISKDESELSKNYPEIIKRFNEITGGSYKVQKEGLFYIPKSSKSKLSINESASSVRSLLDIYFYLNCIARPGHLLMIDEPEMNLHPESQRNFARVIARLVNAGIKVYVTTHSDYFIKELNTLLMLNSKFDKSEKIASIMSEYNYSKEELLRYEQVKLFIAKKSSILIEGNARRTLCHTLVKANVSESGMIADSFDDTIKEMNTLQQSLFFV